MNIYGDKVILNFLSDHTENAEFWTDERTQADEQTQNMLQ
jgi:hypothetical protein